MTSILRSAKVLGKLVCYIKVVFHTFLKAGPENIVRYTEDFAIKRFVKSIVVYVSENK